MSSETDERTPLIHENSGTLSGVFADDASVNISGSRASKSARFRRVGSRERRLTISLGSSISFQCSSLATNLFLSITAIVAGAADIVYRPVFLDAFVKHVSCGYFHSISNNVFLQTYSSICMLIITSVALLICRATIKDFNGTTSLSQPFFCLLGLLSALAFYASFLASLPGRTPPSMQAVFYMTMIPLTVVGRWFILRKTVSTLRLICTFGVMVGTFIVLEPSIFNIDQGDEMKHGHLSESKKAFWMSLYAISFVPLMLMSVSLEYAFEKKVNSDEKMVHPLVLIVWQQVWASAFLVLLSFTDIIPGFGQSGSFDGFISDIGEGLACMFGKAPSPGNCTAELLHTTPLPGQLNPDPACLVPIRRFWIFIFIFFLDNSILLLLVKYSDGAVYAAIVASLKSPLATIFWRLFMLDKFSNLRWHPVFDEQTVYVLVGLCIILPAAIIYNYVTFKEEEEMAPSQSEEPDEGILLPERRFPPNLDRSGCLACCTTRF